MCQSIPSCDPSFAHYRVSPVQTPSSSSGETKEAKKRWGDRGSTKEGEGMLRGCPRIQTFIFCVRSILRASRSECPRRFFFFQMKHGKPRSARPTEASPRGTEACCFPRMSSHSDVPWLQMIVPSIPADVGIIQKSTIVLQAGYQRPRSNRK